MMKTYQPKKKESGVIKAFMKAQCKPKDIETKNRTFEAHLSNLKQKQNYDTKDAPTRAKLK